MSLSSKRYKSQCSCECSRQYDSRQEESYFVAESKRHLASVLESEIAGKISYCGDFAVVTPLDGFGLNCLVDTIALLGKIPYLHEWNGSMLPVLPELVEHSWFQVMTIMDLPPPIALPSSNDNETSRHDYNRIPCLPLMRHCKALKESSTPLQRNPRANSSVLQHACHGKTVILGYFRGNRCRGCVV